MRHIVGILVLLVCLLSGLPAGQEVMAAPQSAEQVNEEGKAIAMIGKIENLKKNDKYGVGIAVVSIGAVFVGLICLYLISKASDKVAFSLRKKRVKMSGYTKEEARDLAAESGEVFAAIAMALEEISEEDHDDENMVLTMKNVARSYSPWSSKIYTLRESPVRR